MGEGIEVGEVINEMEYSFVSTTDNSDIIDMSIENYEVIDSK
jgi:hypothetical protein